VVANGDFTMLLAAHTQIYAFTRELGDDALLVLANVSGEVVPPAGEDSDGALGAWATAELVLGNVHDEPVVDALDPLRPWEARVLRRAG
jgi:oligo-1,6-glucosidase